MLVSQVRPGDILIHHQHIFTVTKVQPANSWPGWPCSAAANVIVTVSGHYPWNNHNSLGEAVHDFWLRSWAARTRLTNGYFPRYAINVALGVAATRNDEDGRSLARMHGEALRYFVQAGVTVCEWQPRQGDYEPDELARQQQETTDRIGARDFPPPAYSRPAQDELREWSYRQQPSVP